MSTLNWAAIVPAAITGAIGLAGIGGTLLSASIARQSNAENLQASIAAENNKARLSEKRCVYANCLAALMFGYLQAAMVRARGDVRSKGYAADVLEANRARMAAVNALSEVRLIGPQDVGSLATRAVMALLRFLKEGGGSDFGKAHAKLTLAMRIDLGEPVPDHLMIEELEGFLPPEAPEQEASGRR